MDAQTHFKTPRGSQLHFISYIREETSSCTHCWDPPTDQVRPTLCKALDQWAPGKRREHVRDRPDTPSPYIWQSSEGHTPLIGTLVPPFFTHN